MACCTAPKLPPEEEFPRQESVTVAKILDEDFECMHRMAQSMCQTLARPKDRKVCSSTLEKLVKFQQTRSSTVKENVRKFMIFYLKVLRWTQSHQPLSLYQQWYGDSFCSDVSTSANVGEMRLWLEKNNSFLAMKTFDDGSVIVYTAVAQKPSAGWAESGLKKFT